MQVDLHDQVARLHGADSRIGRAIAAKLTESGARLAAAGHLDMVVDCDPEAGRLETDVAALRTQGAGRVVVILGSGAAVARRGRGGHADAALAALTRSLALDAAADGVRVNAVIVGPDDALSHTPTGRPPSLASIANAALFLLAPASSYVTGHLLTVDGGFSAAYVRNF